MQSRSTARLQLLDPIPPPKLYRAGRLILDCGGHPHMDWLQESVRDHQMNAIVFRRANHSFYPIHDQDPSLTQATGRLDDHLTSQLGKVHFLLDDLGELHYHENPTRLLERYYTALEGDGFAWIRFPQTLWVLQKDHHRISLAEYLIAKFPRIFHRVGNREISAPLKKELSGTLGLIQMRKDRYTDTLAIPLQLRSWGGTTVPKPSPHCPVLEFIES